jgi:hypothetical protein
MGSGRRMGKGRNRAHMAVTIESADLRRDSDLLRKLLQDHLSADHSPQRFDWLYRQGPHGQARAWLALEPQTNMPVGAAAIFPRRMYFEGQIFTGGVFGDFCIASDFRSLGPAIRLQRACLGMIYENELALGYDFPSKSMLAVYKRLGTETRGQLVRMSKPLRANRMLSEKLRSQIVGRGLSPIANSILRWRDRKLRPKCNLVLALQRPRFGQEFTKLATQVGSLHGICTERSAEYLNWRYSDHPNLHYEVMTARRSGELEAYAIFRQDEGQAWIVDWFGNEENGPRHDVMVGLIASLRERGIETISFPIIGSHPWRREVENIGFRERESCPVMLFNSAKADSANTRQWLLMDGDRES